MDECLALHLLKTHGILAVSGPAAGAGDMPVIRCAQRMMAYWKWLVVLLGRGRTLSCVGSQLWKESVLP